MGSLDYTTFKKNYNYKNVPIWSFYYKYFKRPITMPICWLLYHTFLTPNQLTLIGIVFSIISALAFSTGKYAGFIVGVIFFELFHFADDFDGVIARAKNMRSKRGAWLDAIAGIFGGSLVIIGITLGVFMNYSNVYTLIAGLFALLGLIMFSLIDVETMVHFIGKEFKKKDLSKEESTLKNINKTKVVKIILEFIDSLWHFFLIFSAIFGFMLLYLVLTALYYLLLSLISFMYKYKIYSGA